MNYIIFDLEFNQGFDFKNNTSKTNPKCPFEIIQIGAVKLNHHLHVVSTLNLMIRPQIYKRLHPFVKKLIHIGATDLKEARTFTEAYEDIATFFQGDRNVLCVWGNNDLKELYRNILFYKQDLSSIPRKYINVQKYASHFLNNPSGNSIGLRNAVQLLNISFDENFHDAYNDAYYTAEVFRKIYTPHIKNEIYHYEPLKSGTSPRKRKRIVDYKGLLGQFEKMKDRKLTAEEKEFIKLAYKMGRTHQFDLVSQEKK